MSILFAIVFIVLIFKWKASWCGPQSVWIYRIDRDRSCCVRTFYGVCAGAVMHRGSMAFDQADLLEFC